MAVITNVVTYTELNCTFNLNELAGALNNAVYDPRKFHGLMGQIFEKCTIFPGRQVHFNVLMLAHMVTRSHIKSWSQIMTIVTGFKKIYTFL